MREIYNLIPAEEVESDAQAEPVNIEKLKIEFEMEWRGNRKEHTVIVHEDGRRTMHESYRIPIFKDEHELEHFLPAFGHQAGLLGYRSTIGPVFIPDADHDLLRPKYGSVIFFLERTENADGSIVY